MSVFGRDFFWFFLGLLAATVLPSVLAFVALLLVAGLALATAFRNDFFGLVGDDEEEEDEM